MADEKQALLSNNQQQQPQFPVYYNQQQSPPQPAVGFQQQPIPVQPVLQQSPYMVGLDPNLWVVRKPSFDPVLAAVINIWLPGLGQMLIGQVNTGIGLLFNYILFFFRFISLLVCLWVFFLS